MEQSPRGKLPGRAELLCRQCAIRLRRTSDVPASRCAYNHLAKRKRRYHHLIRLQRYTGRLCEERNNFVGRLLRDSVESLNTWREGRAYVQGRWKKYAHTMISTATKPQSIFSPRSFIAPILTRNDSH